MSGKRDDPHKRPARTPNLVGQEMRVVPRHLLFQASPGPCGGLDRADVGCSGASTQRAPAGARAARLPATSWQADVADSVRAGTHFAGGSGRRDLRRL